MKKTIVLILTMLIMVMGAGMTRADEMTFLQTADMKHRQNLINDAWLIIQRMNQKIEQWIRHAMGKFELPRTWFISSPGTLSRRLRNSGASTTV